MIFDIVFTLVIWSFIGYIVSDFIMYCCKEEAIRRGEMSSIKGFEYLNPMWLYRNFKVNYLGCALLTVTYNLLCPLGAAYYWLIYICTVGRK